MNFRNTRTVLHSHMLPKLKSITVNHADPVHMAPLPDDAGHVDGFPQLGLVVRVWEESPEISLSQNFQQGPNDSFTLDAPIASVKQSPHCQDSCLAFASTAACLA